MRPQLLTPIKILYAGRDDRLPDQPDSDRVFDNLAVNAMAQVLYIRGSTLAGLEFTGGELLSASVRVTIHKQVLHQPEITAGNLHQPAEVMFNSQVDSIVERWDIQSLAPAIIKGDPLQRLPYTEITCTNVKRSSIILPAQELCWDGDNVTYDGERVAF